MKVAIVHDWLVTNAGAEKVLKAIIDLYPNADVFSLVDFLDDNLRMKVLDGKKTKVSFIQKLPFSKKKFRNYLPLFPKAIESFDLSKYDLVISSSWAVAKGVKTSRSQLHICYCYTPIRYAWDLYDEYTSNLPILKKKAVQYTLRYIRNWDLINSKRVNTFIADSNFVRDRILKTYNRKSSVIYPPVETSRFILEIQKDEYYLTASRLVAYKKIKLIVESFNNMPKKKLIVIGSGEEYKSIKKIAKNNIVLLGYQDDDILIKYMQKAKAFVYAAIEDFGIIPIEAQSCGTPVIALDKGGTAETVVDGLNGIHYKNQKKEDIIAAVEKFEKMTFDAIKVSQSVQKFSKVRFKKDLKKFIDEELKGFLSDKCI